MEITNQFHREMIEETCDFRLADSLGLKSCGVCAISGILTLVPDDAPAVQFHDYPGSLRCLPLPVCQSCGEEMDDEIDPGMYGCPDQGCQVAVEEWRAERAAQQDPLFYGYEAHPDAGPSRVTIDQDVRWGDTLRPAGDIHAFSTEEELNAWVEEGCTLIKNSLGYVEEYRARSAVSRDRGSRLYVPADEDTDLCR